MHWRVFEMECFPLFSYVKRIGTAVAQKPGQQIQKSYQIHPNICKINTLLAKQTQIMACKYLIICVSMSQNKSNLTWGPKNVF